MRSKFGVSPLLALEFYNLSVVIFNVCKVLLMPLSVASLKQLSASFLQVSQVFIHCMVLEIQLLLLMPSAK